MLVPVEYRGELVALASRERFHIVSPRRAVRSAGDPELRFVALMCAYWGQVLGDGLSHGITNALIEEGARRALIGTEALDSVARLKDEQAAAALNVPVEQLRLARRGAADASIA